MRVLIKRRSVLPVFVVFIVALAAGWVYWNRVVRAEMSAWAPGDSLGFAEVDDLPEVLRGIESREAWKSLAAPLGAPSALSTNRWWIRLARWTGIGSSDAVLLARSQVAVVFGGAAVSQDGSSLTVKPLLTFIFETHTSQRRMRAAVERHIEDLARRVFENPALVRKQVNGIDLTEWVSADASHQIVFAFVGTAAVVGNDEGSVVRSIEAHSGHRTSLRDEKKIEETRGNINAAQASAFGFVSQSGVKLLLLAFALSRGGSSEDSMTAARIFSDTIGGVIKNVSWTARFRDGMVEDQCFVALNEGVADKLIVSVTPDRAPDLMNLSFAPADVFSVSLYQFHDPASFWSDLNATIAAHTDLVGAIAARPMLRAFLKPYGIDDPDIFAHAIGPRLQTIRYDESSPSVLVAEAYDRPALRKAIARRFGEKPKSEKLGEFDLLLSGDNWAATFVENYFLIGRADAVRRSLMGRIQAQSISSAEPFRKSEQLVDLSLPITGLTFTNDQSAAISFVETFSPRERPAFSSNADAIEQAIRSLPYGVSISMVKPTGIEWTSRSSFGIGGALVVRFFPDKSK